MPITYIEKAYGGCDLFHLLTCEDCGKQYYHKINHIYGGKTFDRMKAEGNPIVTPLIDGCDCEHDDED